MSEYDVFLSHNSADKPAVEAIARRLRELAHLEPFLDKWHLVPGEPWQEALEEAIDASCSCAVFLGPTGMGSWENEEMRAALDIRVRQPAFRVIPVLLPGARLPERGRLPRFLSRLTWVDFRPGLDDADAFHRLVCGIQGVAPGPAGVTEAEAVCPFRGLQVFDEEHAPFFFGREALTQHLVEQLRSDRFLAVIGPSGSGKSSLVRAGLLPQVRAGALPASDRWPVVLCKPGPHPVETLAARLLPHLGESSDPLATRQSLIDALARDERGLHATIQVALASAPDSQRLLLVVDQFEELFTLCREEEERASFIANLLYASAIAGGQTVAVVTMRADFFGKCTAYPELAARLGERDVLVGPMSEEDLRRAMEGPAEAVGLHYEKGLVETILDDLGDEPGSLPLLQHTLWRLWQEGRRGAWLTIDKYHEIGGVQGALTKWADEKYGELEPDRQKIAQRILLRLTQPGEETEDTRRRVKETELMPKDPGKTLATKETIQTLIDARLLTQSKNERDESVIEVAHEALIRHWPLLRTWLNDSRTKLLLQRRLIDAANVWDGNDRKGSYLYRGSQLAEVRGKLPDAGLGTSERDFVRASIKGHYYRMLAQIGIASLVVLLIAVIGFIIWQSRSPWNRIFDDDQVWALAVSDEVPSTYYVGTKDSGFRRSVDGVTWTTLQGGLPTVMGDPGRNIPAVRRIAIDSQNPKRLFAFLSGQGVYRSLDGGESWELSGSGVLTTSVVIDLAVYGDLVLAVSDKDDDCALYVSQNGGQDWHLAGGKGDTLFGRVYAVHIDSYGEYIYVGAETGFYRSSTQEQIIDTSTWHEIDNLSTVTSVESTKGPDEVFYLAAKNPDEIGSIYRWRSPEPTAERLSDVKNQPYVLAPHPDQTGPVLAYILFGDGQVFALQRTGEQVSLGQAPSGYALALLARPHPTEGRLWLLLGHEGGLYEYSDSLD